MSGLSGKPEIVRRIPAQIDPVLLEQDLLRLRDKALAGGADDAAVIGKQDILFDARVLERVEADNRFPSIHWPLRYEKDDLKGAILLYDRAIFFSLNPLPGMPDYGGGPIPDDAHRRLYLKTYEIVTLIESAAFYMGYHLSMGLASGNCRSVFCADEKRCWAMLKGKVCIHPNIGRPSMEAAGIDARSMGKRLNWPVSKDLSSPLLGGLVMIV